MNSMAFYDEVRRQDIRPQLIFVDGNHEYEFALFDIQCAARYLMPGGFIIADDAGQAGPYFAARDFLARHPDWIECPSADHLQWDPTKAFDKSRSHVPRTGFFILRAPTHWRLFDARPLTFGEMAWDRPEARGIALSLDGRQEAGTLHVQCVLRGYGAEQPTEIVISASKEIARNARDVEVIFPQSLPAPRSRGRYTLEPWVIWIGQGPLCLRSAPTPF
jgi:hypothetical protein